MALHVAGLVGKSQMEKKKKNWKGVCVVGVVFKGENTFIYFYIHFLNIYILFYSFTVFRKRFLRRLLGTVENGG